MTVSSALEITNLSVTINKLQILKHISLQIPKHKITCIIGPSGSGKSTLIRTINRINANTDDLKTTGQILFNQQDILSTSTALPELRTQIGMVFQKPCVFPVSIKENVLFGIKRLQKLSKLDKENITAEHLKQVALWDEVSTRLDIPATALSIGQQQRLCIARSLAIKPQVLLLDEPTSALDPVSTFAIERMMLTLKETYTIVFVSHNLEQAKRIADHIVFISDGELIEQGSAERVFNHPTQPKTQRYLTSSL